MSFFPTEPPSEPAPEPQREPDPPWLGPPRSEVPGVLPVSALLGSTRHAALVLRSVRVHSTGVAFDLQSLLRRADATDEEWDDLQGRVGMGFGRRRGRSRGRVGSGHRLGVLLADGTRVLTDGSGPDRDDGPRLTQGAGAGTGGDDFTEHTWAYWLWPLPAGAVVLVADWVALDLPEARTTIEGDALLAAAAAVIPIWPGPGAAGAGRQRVV